MTTTWSPLFRCGVNVGLCLPRRIAATPDARRPRTWSVASTTYQSLFKSAAFAVHVFCFVIFWLLKPLSLTLSPMGRGELLNHLTLSPMGRGELVNHFH